MLERICGKKKDSIIELAEKYRKENSDFPEYEQFLNELISADIENVMNNIRFIIGNSNFDEIVLGVTASEQTEPALTEDDIFAFGAALYAWL